MRQLILLALLIATPALGEQPPEPPPAWTFEIGDSLPLATLVSLEGEPSQLPTGPLLINIFATHCGPCRAEMPQIEKEIWRPYRDRGLKVVAVDRGEDAARVRPFIAAIGITYPVLLDPDREFFNAIAADQLGIPRTILVDAEGKVRWRELGFHPKTSTAVLKHQIDRMLSSNAD